MSSGILQPLIRSNIALLSQKIALLDLLVGRYGASSAAVQFTKTCPLVGASIGQHYRHSMDHIELVALLASSSDSHIIPSRKRELHYDLRVRGGTLEKDLGMSRQRIVDVVDVFKSLQPGAESVTTTPLTAYFNLSADSDVEIGLPSTVGRELGFAAHHTIHHMALVKIIALQTLGLDETDLPHGFGRAPSTLIFDRNTNN
jgi:hypothetical protein